MVLKVIYLPEKACTTGNFKFEPPEPLANVQNNPAMGGSYCNELLLSAPLFKSMKN